MQDTHNQTNWNSTLYDQKHAFVYKFGEDVLNLLAPKEGERILDIGCGTGYLTNAIAAHGAVVTGIDNSPAMIEKAQAMYPDLDFRVISAADFHFEKQPFDALFSNAALHWVLEKEAAIQCMYNSLKPGGRLVLEMGGKDNIKSIVQAIETVLTAYGFANVADTRTWFFPSLAAYATLLEQQGFTVNLAVYFARQTKLEGEEGMKDWIKMFADSYLRHIPGGQQDSLLNEMCQLLRPAHYNDNNWFADYRRLRILATKP